MVFGFGCAIETCTSMGTSVGNSMRRKRMFFGFWLRNGNMHIAQATPPVCCPRIKTLQFQYNAMQINGNEYYTMHCKSMETNIRHCNVQINKNENNAMQLNITQWKAALQQKKHNTMHDHNTQYHTTMPKPKHCNLI